MLKNVNQLNYETLSNSTLHSKVLFNSDSKPIKEKGSMVQKRKKKNLKSLKSDY